MKQDISDPENLILQIRQQGKNGGPFLIAIDGRCAAGKTTLAALLAQKLDCPVFHMDDFYLRPEQRTAERYAQPGGNVDRERFLEEVLLPLSGGEKLIYRPYSCHTQTLLAPVCVAPASCAVIEGSYSCHPDLWDLYDLHIFLDIDRDTQLARIRARNGEQALAAFTEKWIPMEEQYFTAYAVCARSEIYLARNPLSISIGIL